MARRLALRLARGALVVDPLRVRPLVGDVRPRFLVRVGPRVAARLVALPLPKVALVLSMDRRRPRLARVVGLEGAGELVPFLVPQLLGVVALVLPLGLVPYLLWVLARVSQPNADPHEKD